MSRTQRIDNVYIEQASDAELDRMIDITESNLRSLMIEKKARDKIKRDEEILKNPFRRGDKVRTKYMSDSHYGVVKVVNPKSVRVDVYYTPSYGYRGELIKMHERFAYSDRIPLARVIRIAEPVE